MSPQPRASRPDSDAHTHDKPIVVNASRGSVRRAAALFRAVGDPARLALLDCLAGGERCVSELADASGDHLSTISERLRVLRAEGLVGRRREGKHIYYTLADAHVLTLIRSALEHVTEQRRIAAEEE